MKAERVAGGIWKVTVGEPEQHTPVYHRSVPMRREALEEMEEKELPFSTEEIRCRRNRRGVQITLPMDSGEDIYGFGLQLGSMNQAGRKRIVRVNSDPAADTGEGHAPVPFYISTAGYGLFVDTYRHVEFYMGTSLERGKSREKKEVNQPHTEFSESALYALKRNRERRSVIIDVKGVDGAAFYLFSGGVKEVVCRYNLFAGGGCLPPMWGLGIWYRTYGGSDERQVLELAEAFRREKIPVDVLGLEPGWQSHSYSCTYEWSDLFPHPEEMTEELREQGYKVNLWEHIFVYPAASIYEELLPWSGEYEVWNGLVPDFATEEAAGIFRRLHREHFLKAGIAGFKLDECDNSDFNGSNWSFPDTSEFPSGMDGEQMHGALGTLYQKVVWDMYREEGKRTYSQVRSSGALASPFPFVLYSDLYNHRQFIRGMVTSGFSGLLWAPEVRNCSSGEDLLRRMETICFSLHAIYNCWRIPNPPWKQVDIRKNLAGEEMENAAYYTEICRRYHRLRMSLLPYLYSAFVKYYKQGIPPLRALVMEYEEDPNVRNIDDEYMLGDDILAAPMTLEDGVSRKVYLPRGVWHDFFDGTVYQGGATYEMEADYDRIPVFVRDGCILPLAEPVEAVTEETVFVIHPRVYGDGGDGCVLYEDDFESFRYLETEPNEVRLYMAGGKVEYERKGNERVRYLFGQAVPILEEALRGAGEFGVPT